MAGYLGAYADQTGFASGLLFQVALELKQVNGRMTTANDAINYDGPLLT